MNRQSVSLSVLLGAVVFFFYSLADVIAPHQQWSEVTTPASIGEILRLVAAFVAAVGGALGVTLSRALKPKPPARRTRRGMAIDQDPDRLP